MEEGQTVMVLCEIKKGVWQGLPYAFLGTRVMLFNLA